MADRDDRTLGVSKHHEAVVSFIAQQMIDVVSPANFVATNPELLEETVRQGGMNLLRERQFP